VSGRAERQQHRTGNRDRDRRGMKYEKVRG
jgi:hypothetical protein